MTGNGQVGEARQETQATAEELAAAFEAAINAEPLAVEATMIDESEQVELPDAADLERGLAETIVSSSPQWTGAFLTVDDVVVTLPNGKLAHHDVVRHPGAVAIIALTDNNKLVVVHQYRTSLEQVTVEIPAGKLAPGEDPAKAAARELSEETGYEAEQLAYLGPIAVAAGYSDEIIHMFLAMGLAFVGAHPDDDEFVTVDLLDLSDAVDLVLDGKIIDSKTVTGILLADAILRRMQS